MYKDITVINIQHEDLTLPYLKLLYCVYNPMFKTSKVQYNWVIKQCRKYADKYIGKHINCHFEFVKDNTFTYLTIFYNDNVVKMSCRNSYFVNQGMTKPQKFIV